jgi:glutamate-1-semialdehyde aminotransferase
MARRHGLCTAAFAVIFAAGAAQLAAAQETAFSRLQRNPNVLQGTIEEIAPNARTLVLVGTDGRRRTIHFDEGTVVFTDQSNLSNDRVMPGTEAAVLCHRKIVEIHGAGKTDVCPMRIFADSVYLASN